MKTMHLFAGVGGGLFADLILGHKPICAVELNPYRCDVLRERSEDGTFPGLHVHEGDVREFDPTPWTGRVAQISAGFPCTDISCAGKGAGIAGPQSGLWSEVVRCVRILRPGLVFLENSPAITSRGLGAVLGDLASLGYDAEWCVLGADEIGAPHIRDRWWCLAYPISDGWDSFGTGSTRQQRKVGSCGTTKQIANTHRHGDKRITNTSTRDEHHGNDAGWQEETGMPQGSHEAPPYTHEFHGDRCRFYPSTIPQFEAPEVRGCEEVADTCGNGPQESVFEGWLPESDREAIQAVKGYCGTRDWNPSFTNLCRVVHGLPANINAYKGKRIEGLGDAQVPLQAATAWSILSELINR